MVIFQLQIINNNISCAIGVYGRFFWPTFGNINIYYNNRALEVENSGVDKRFSDGIIV